MREEESRSGMNGLYQNGSEGGQFEGGRCNRLDKDLWRSGGQAEKKNKLHFF